MTYTEWLQQFTPADVIAVIAIVASSTFAITTVYLQIRARRIDAMADARRDVHLRFWNAASAWLRQLQQTLAGEPVRPHEGDLLDRRRETHAAFREIEVASPSLFSPCSRVVTGLDLAHSSLERAVEMGYVHPGDVVKSAAEATVAKHEVSAASAALDDLLEDLRAFNERGTLKRRRRTRSDTR